MANTIIGSTITVDGEITGSDPVIVQGTVKGRIALEDNVYIDESGVVEANIETPNVEISGQFTGDIAASERVELKPEARMSGNIRSPRILIADGASFKGHIDMDV
ncbi:MAG: polymer-forming cytoskeletal protein [Myxococcota bacterium]